MKEDYQEKLKELVNKCDRCGACTLVCPLYKAQGLDRATARGKLSLLSLILTNEIDSKQKKIRDALDYCLLCKACTEVCPSKIMTDEAMINIRQSLRDKHGLPMKYRLIGNSLGNIYFKEISSRGATLAQKLQIPRITKGYFPTNNKSLQMRYGPAAISSDIKIECNIDLKKIKDVAYFQGCAMKLFFKNASKSTEQLIKKTGCIVHKPKVNCCGLPQQSHGMLDMAKEMAKKNIDLLLEFDLIITDCGSCFSMLKSYAKLFENDFTYKRKAREISKKTMGLSEYLYAIGYTPSSNKQLKVTYHSSCHLKRGQNVEEAPESLLKKGTTYFPAKHKNMCCGGAGTFQIDFPEISNKILEMKFNDFKSTGADIIVTECPSCLMQLGKLEKYKEFKILHISQVL